MNNSSLDKKKGKFITLEGIDGSGKSTQIKLIKSKLEAINQKCYFTAEPTGGPIGTLIRQILSGRIKASEEVIASLYASDRLDHLLNDINGIKAKIENNINVITDRYYFSSYAYHGVNLSMDWVINANSYSKKHLKPDCNVFIDLDPKIAIERMRENRFDVDLYENLNTLIKVREKYFEAFEKEKDENIIIVDGNNDAETVSELIWEQIKKYFE